MLLALEFVLFSRAVNANDDDNYFCVLTLIKKSTKEEIKTAYGMGNIGDQVDLDELCLDFYSRDITTQSSDLVLVDSWGDISSDPDQFWLDNNSRRLLNDQELEDYACLWSSDNFLGVLSDNVTDLLPETPDSLRIPSLLLTALAEFDSPMLRFLVLQTWQTALPILGIGSVVKLYHLIKR